MGGRGAKAGNVAEKGSNAVYKPQNAYESYKEKMFKYSGTTENEDGSLNYGQKDYSGKVYTNAEFMEHLEDGNWHSLHSAILENKLTNAEVSYIKNNMRFGLWSFGKYKGLNSSNYKTGAEYTKAIIKDATKGRREKIAKLDQKIAKANNTVDKQYYLRQKRKLEMGLK